MNHDYNTQRKRILVSAIEDSEEPEQTIVTTNYYVKNRMILKFTQRLRERNHNLLKNCVLLRLQV